MAKFQSLKEAVAENLRDGDTIAFEGFTHLIPQAAAHEVIRQGIKDLTLIRMTPDIIYDQMIGMGLVKKVIFSYAGNPGVGLLRRMRDAIENSWPRPIETEEHSHAAMANAYEAGAAGLPCAVFRGYRGAGLKEVNPSIRSITCPFTGEELAAVPAHRPDVAVIHAQKANRRGDVLVEGIIGVQKEAVLASKRSVVTVEEIVEDFDDLHPNLCVLPHWTVSSIARVPGGAHPSYTHGYYDRDNAAYLEWDKISADRDLFTAWMRENVLGAGPEVFATRVKGL
ncbi:CoA transferase subunit A [Microvirga terrestris]|uniref:CoA transferase subunit A n=1 Tax=Microvirga terrestris TaxID=2791024 RepID=A0ABS0HWW9_9HYPH|nr:CoA transferase subunit A [Microvirga terrestris]MBF9198004.1 CoA transferase subunit A [Microvirga terrestris]